MVSKWGDSSNSQALFTPILFNFRYRNDSIVTKCDEQIQLNIFTAISLATTTEWLPIYEW